MSLYSGIPGVFFFIKVGLCSNAYYKSTDYSMNILIYGFIRRIIPQLFSRENFLYALSMINLDSVIIAFSTFIQGYFCLTGIDL